MAEGNNMAKGNNRQADSLHIAHVNLAKGFRGGERQTQLLIEALGKKNITQTVVLHADSPLREQLAGLPNLTCIVCKKPYARAVFSLPKVDLLHAHDGKAVHWCRLVKLLRGFPYIINRRISKQPKNNWFSKNSYRHAIRIIGLSHAIKQAVRSVIPNIPIDIIPDMSAQFQINLDKVNQLHQRYEGKFVIGHIGALENRDKGQQYLIEAAQILTRKYPEFIFLFLGEGRDRSAFETQINGNPAIKLLGFQKNVGDYLHIFDLFVFPSLQEGLGSTLLDVMQAGIPIIASNTGGIPDIIEHNKNGLLIEPANSQAIVKAIEILYTNSALAQQLVADALARVEHYTPETISARYLILYRQLLQTKPSTLNSALKPESDSLKKDIKSKCP